MNCDRCAMSGHCNDEEEKRRALSCSAPATGSVSSVRHQLNIAMISEAGFRAMCIKEGLETEPQIDACRRVMMHLCDRVEKKQNVKHEG